MSVPQPSFFPEVTVKALPRYYFTKFSREDFEACDEYQEELYAMLDRARAAAALALYLEAQSRGATIATMANGHPGFMLRYPVISHAALPLQLQTSAS